MLYETVKIKDKEYKCRLNAKAMVDLERMLGKNPIAMFMNENDLPKNEDMITLFYTSLKAYQPEITIDETYDLVDEFYEDGNDLTQFIELIVKIFTSAGFIPQDKKGKKAKN